MVGGGGGGTNQMSSYGGWEGLGHLLGGIFMRAINQSFCDKVPWYSLTHDHMIVPRGGADTLPGGRE